MAPGEIAPAAATAFAAEIAVPGGGGRKPDLEADMGIGDGRGDTDDAAEGHGDFCRANGVAVQLVDGAFDHGMGRDGATRQRDAALRIASLRIVGAGIGRMRGAARQQRQGGDR
jgi:hypothetical protein